MEINLQKISGLTIIIGSLLFLIAAFSPISRVFGESSAVRRLEIIMDSFNQWTVAQFFFASGAVITVIGIFVVSIYVRNQPYAVYTFISVVLLFAGVVLWSWHVYMRAVDPAAFTGQAIPMWLFAGYTLLTQMGLIIFGIALLRTLLPDWVGWMMIGSMILFFLLTMIFRDMPPFVYYIITLITGLMIYRIDELIAY